jgi:hypothetical protein
VYGRYAKTPPIINSTEAYKYGLEFLAGTKSQYGPVYEEGRHIKLRIVLDNRTKRFTCHGTIDHVEILKGSGEYKLGVSHLSLSDEEFELLKEFSVDTPLQSILFVSSVREAPSDAQPVVSDKDQKEIKRIKAVTLPVSLIESIDDQRGSTPFSEFMVEAIKKHIS